MTTQLRQDGRGVADAGAAVAPLEEEFRRAMDEYKKSSGRMFPTWSEVLEVLGELGYTKDDCSDGDHARPR